MSEQRLCRVDLAGHEVDALRALVGERLSGEDLDRLFEMVEAGAANRVWRERELAKAAAGLPSIYEPIG